MKAKFKLKQLESVDTIDKELVHPKHGNTGIMVKLAGPTHPVWKEALKVWRDSEDTEEDNKRLVSSAILGWDEEAFEAPYSKEAVIEAFSNPGNEWMVEYVFGTIREHKNFFQ